MGITLNSDLERRIAAKVQSGRYQSPAYATLASDNTATRVHVYG